MGISGNKDRKNVCRCVFFPILRGIWIVGNAKIFTRRSRSVHMLFRVTFNASPRVSDLGIVHGFRTVI